MLRELAKDAASTRAVRSPRVLELPVLVPRTLFVLWRSPPTAVVRPSADVHPLKAVPLRTAAPAPRISSRSDTGRDTGRGADASRNGVPSPTAAPAAYCSIPAGASDIGAAMAACSSRGSASRAAAPNAGTSSCGDRVWSQRQKHCNDPKTGNDSPFAHFHNSPSHFWLSSLSSASNATELERFPCFAIRPEVTGSLRDRDVSCPPWRIRGSAKSDGQKASRARRVRARCCIDNG